MPSDGDEPRRRGRNTRNASQSQRAATPVPERGRTIGSRRAGARPSQAVAPSGDLARPRRGSLGEEIRATARPAKADEALRSFEQAVALAERGRDDAAVRAAQTAKGCAPRSGAVREVLGIALYRTGRYREALQELRAYRRMTGRRDQNHLIADCHRALGAPDKALEPVREALEARIPEEARVEAAVVGASALADLGRFSEALGMLRAVGVHGAVKPFVLRLWYTTGDVLQRAGRGREA